jgi:hypothetical protein
MLKPANHDARSDSDHVREFVYLVRVLEAGEPSCLTRWYEQVAGEPVRLGLAWIISRCRGLDPHVCLAVPQHVGDLVKKGEP